MLLKRLFDLVASLTGLIVLSPLLLAIAVAIPLESSGPTLFLQERVGRNGRRFRIVKFRTMKSTEDRDAPQITASHDPRITRLGALLRSTKLDELPQLLNVLRGEMSIVGPRPEVPTYMNLYTPEQRHLILSVRPGITDLAAIEFRSEEKLLAEAQNPHETYIKDIMPAKFALYKKYVERRSMFMDVDIILKTLLRVTNNH